MFVAIDRTSKAAFVQLHGRANTQTAVTFLNDLIEAMPYAIHTVLTELIGREPINCTQFADLPKTRDKPTARWRGHPFNRACAIHGIEHRLTKPNNPWSSRDRLRSKRSSQNGQVERMNRTLKEATVRCYHYESHDRLKARLAALSTPTTSPSD